MIDQSQFSLQTLERLETLLEEFREFEFTTDGLVKFEWRDNEYLVICKYVAENYKFSFGIIYPQSELETTVVTKGLSVDYWPQKYDNLNEHALNQIAFADIPKRYLGWLEMIKKYDEIKLNPEDRFLKQYEKEIEAEFEFIDEEGDEEAYDDERQKFIYRYLTYFESRLQEETQTEEIKKIVDDVKDLKDNIQNRSKKIIKASFKTILAYTKKQSPKLFWDVVDVAKKELIKAALKGGLTHGIDFVNSFQSLIHL